MQNNPGLYLTYRNGKFANSKWSDKNGNIVLFTDINATFYGNIWAGYNNREFQSEYTGNDSITVYENAMAKFRFTLSNIFPNKALVESNMMDNPFFEI